MAPKVDKYAPPSNISGAEKFDSTVLIEGFETWSPEDLADFFEEQGLGDYREVFIYHKISGSIAPQLTDADLKDMGIKIVGDRCRFRHVLKSMSRKARLIQRNKILWSGKEELWFDKCEAGVNTCCGMFPEDPSTYRLTNNHLRIKTVDPARCGPVRLCCCHRYNINNIDLSNVDDVDMSNIPPPFYAQLFCCAHGKEVLDVNVQNEGSSYIILAEGEGDKVSALILNQVEESQMIERD